MANKKNGKWVVAAVLGSVVLVAAIAVFVQRQINANQGKPPTKQPYQPEAVQGVDE